MMKMLDALTMWCNADIHIADLFKTEGEGERHARMNAPRAQA